MYLLSYSEPVILPAFFRLNRSTINKENEDAERTCDGDIGRGRRLHGGCDRCVPPAHAERGRGISKICAAATSAHFASLREIFTTGELK